MGQDGLVTVWLLLAAVAVNLPWLSDRVLLVRAAGPAGKPAWLRWLEWAGLAALVIAAGLATEWKATGDRHAQDWEFYVVTICLSLVAATPGFVYRYQWLPLRRRRARSL